MTFFTFFYIDEPSDESYTPERISVRVGTNEHDLREVINEDIKELNNGLKIYTIYCINNDLRGGFLASFFLYHPVNRTVQLCLKLCLKLQRAFLSKKD